MTQEELEQAQADILDRLDIQEMSDGALTLTAMVGRLNGTDVYGRVMMTEGHAIWLEEILSLDFEEDEDEG